MLLLLQLQIVQKVVHGNSVTATTASNCTGNSATATKLQTARKIILDGVINGEAELDGSKDITITAKQANIAVVKGIITANTGSKTINYPNGYNKDNCVVIASMFNNSIKENYGTGSTFDTSSYLNGNFATAIVLSDNSIIVKVKLINISSEQYPITDDIAVDVNYKIVLMKI